MVISIAPQYIVWYRLVYYLMVYKETTNINHILYFMFIMLLLNCNLKININTKNNGIVDIKHCKTTKFWKIKNFIFIK